MTAENHDVIITGGTLIDPAAGRSGRFDLGIRDGRVAAVAPSLPRASAPRWIDAAGKLVVPGLIDTHAHVYEHVTGKFGLDPDLVGVRSGVTTLVDQGGPSCMTIPGFRHYVAERAASRVLCFISTYLVGGLEGHRYPELYGPDGGERRAHGARDRGEPRPRRGIKSHAEIGGASRWGGRSDQARQGDLPADGGPPLRPPGAALAAPGTGWRSTPTPTFARSSPCSTPATCSPIPSPAIRAASCPARRGRSTRSSRRRSGAASRWTSATLALQLRHGAPRPRRRHPSLDPRGGPARLQRAGARGPDERPGAVREPLLRRRALQPHPSP